MILVDSNVLLDIFTTDSDWYNWSLEHFKTLSEKHEFLINNIIYTEVSIRFDKIEEVELSLIDFKLLSIPKEALFLAGKIYLEYRKNNGNKHSVLPDFFIGAHATILGIPLFTRDAGRYKTYFPKLELITP